MTAQDLRFSLRQLFRHPGHTVTAVLALGLGIGLATAMLTRTDPLIAIRYD
ncbi:MAG TPA: hypothetical protein VIA62_04220 [Thermoanaerobaculia bacterium]|nr:hypothetical protein [Thermoanaerobaculia bacterium]